ncbi:MAG: ABC transporter ATP-binding protein [Pseudomonadota bacterium]
MSKTLSIDDINVSIDGKHIIHDMNFVIPEGQIACLVGPSGCGKTTILRSIAGFQTVSSGKISVANNVISSPTHQLAVEKRRIGMMFQDYALFPHLTIEQNICFGITSLPPHEQRSRLHELLELTNLGNISARYPHELSGGQQQRVALARALAPKPDLMLLDEPFSNIDSELRQQLANDVRNILKTENITALMVTHDQLEAFAIADNIGVINRGSLEQWGSPYTLYHQPQSRFVANFIGQGRFITGEVSADNTIKTFLGELSLEYNGMTIGQRTDVLIRPDDIIHDDDSGLFGLVLDKRFLGAQFLYELELDNRERVLCYALSHHNHRIGEKIGIKADIEHAVYF